MTTTKKKSAAVYARYSTDLQNDKSIDDQVTLCRQLAERNGCEIKGDLIFTDRAKSSASMFDRDGLLAMMTLAKKRGFKAILCESLDRLSRDPEDLPGIFKRLTFNDIAIITPDGVTTDIQIGIRGITGPMFLKDLSSKVRRHHDGRAREGLIPGALTFGYRAKPGGKKGEREIDPKEAKTVIRIFEEYSAGKTAKDIAAGLSRDGIPSPSGDANWHHQAFTHGRGGSRGMIGNQLYIGKLTWNAYRTVRNPDTGKKVRKKNKPEDVIVTDVPHLRIISQDLWERANGLCKSRGEALFGPGARRPAISRTMRASLLAGLLVCETCGGHMRINKSKQSSRGDTSSRVACAAASGRGTCEHSKSYDLGQLEKTVLDGVEKHLTSPEALIRYTKEYHARYAERQKQARGDLDRWRKELNRTTVQIDRIITAITDSDEPVPVLMKKMKALEIERVGLAERVRLIESETNVVTLHPEALKKFSTDIKRIHRALSGDLSNDALAPFRVAFHNVFDRIVVHPTASRAAYEITPYARLSAIMGIDLFPKMRSAKEMLAEQAVSAVPVDTGKRALARQDWNRQKGVISLGRWRAAA